LTQSETGEPGSGTVAASLADLRAWWRHVGGFNAGVAAIIAAQTVWFAVLMHTGWYYQADFDNLAAATGQRLSWTYLTTSQGGHLDVAGRLVLWLLNRTIPLNYNATIGLRLIVSAVVTYLLARLLRDLVGARRGVLALLLLFALSPMLVQSTLWLTSSINFLISELLIILALRSHLRYAVTGRLRWAVGTATAMLGATLVAEQAAVTALAFPLLTFGFLAEGGLRDRVRAVLRSWPAWTLIAVPIIGFAAFYFTSGKYATTSSGFGASDAVHLVSSFWFDTLIPGLFGGPFAWTTTGGNYFAFDNAPLAVRVAAVALLVLAIGWTVRRTSARALYGWLIPLLVSTVGMVFVGRARFELFGEFAVSRHFEYASYAAVPAAVGVALAVWATSASEIRGRVGGEAVTSDDVDADRPSRRFGCWSRRAVVGVLALASAVSGVTYAHSWSQSPSKGYVARLAAGLSRSGSDATVFDTFVANDVMPGIQIHRHVSDLLALMSSHAHLNNGPVPAQVVDNRGRLVKAQFLTSASVNIKQRNSFCNDLISPQTDKTRRLDQTPHLNEWFLRLTYFEQVPTPITVHVVTAQGTTITPDGGSRVFLNARVGNVYLRLPSAMPSAIRVQGASPTSNVCLTGIAVGYPFPAG
jgi:hypothetical protein